MNLASTLHVVRLVEVVSASCNATPVMVSGVVTARANPLHSFSTPAPGMPLEDKTNMTTESLLRQSTKKYRHSQYQHITVQDIGFKN